MVFPILLLTLLATLLVGALILSSRARSVRALPYVSQERRREVPSALLVQPNLNAAISIGPSNDRVGLAEVVCAASQRSRRRILVRPSERLIIGPPRMRSAIIIAPTPSITIGPVPSIQEQPRPVTRLAPVSEIPAAPIIGIEPSQKTKIVVAPAPRISIEPSLATKVLVGPTPIIAIEPSNAPALIIRPALPAISVEPARRGAWDERGWRRRRENGHEVYEGTYQVVKRRSGDQREFQGRVTVNGRHVTAYIADPPAEIKLHPHGACFQLYRAPWFQLHWSRPAGNPDDAILYMERVLDESINI